MSRQRRCPVPGCPKRGKPAALAAHRRDKHPEISAETYTRMQRGDTARDLGPVIQRRFLRIAAVVAALVVFTYAVVAYIHWTV